MNSIQPDVDSQKVKDIIRAYSSGVVCGVITFTLPLWQPIKLSDIGLDVALILTLAWGVSQKSRVCSTGLFLYYIGTVIYEAYITNGASVNAGIVIRAMFGYWFFKGMIATYDWHKLNLNTESNFKLTDTIFFDRDKFSINSTCNYLKNHWYGDLSLFKSLVINFWLISLLAATLYYCTALLIGKIIDDSRYVAASMLILILTSGPLFIWQIVGLARSAKRCQKSGKTNASTNLLWVVITLLATLNIYYNYLFTTPFVIEFYQISQSDKHYPEFVVKVLPSGKEIEISGGIRTGSADKFIALLECTPYVETIHINSSGGRIKEALKIAQLIHRNGLNTYVSTSSESAGSLIFLAGKKRFAKKSSKLGFHSASYAGFSEKDLNITVGETEKRLKEIGVNQNFVEKIKGTKPSEMWYPDIATLLVEKVVTDIAAANKFSLSDTVSSSIIGMDDATFTQLYSKACPSIELLERKIPGTIASIRKQYRDSIAAGKSEADVEFTVRNFVGEIYAELPILRNHETMGALFLFITKLFENESNASIDDIDNFLGSKPLSGGRASSEVFTHFPAKEYDDFYLALLNSDKEIDDNLWDSDAARKDYMEVIEVMKKTNNDLYQIHFASAKDSSIHTKEQNFNAKLKLFQIAKDIIPPERLGNWYRWYIE